MNVELIMIFYGKPVSLKEILIDGCGKTFVVLIKWILRFPKFLKMSIILIYFNT